MKSEKETIWNRITEIVSSLAIGENASISAMSQTLGLPEAVLRQNLIALNKYGVPICSIEETEDANAIEHSRNVETLMLDCDLPGFSISPYALFLSKGEQDLLKESSKSTLSVKDLPLDIPNSTGQSAITASSSDKLNQIEEALKLNCLVRFRYKSPKTGISTIIVEPRKLFYNAFSGRHYLLEFKDSDTICAYRVDRILYQVTLLKNQKCSPLSSNDPRWEHINYIWGASFGNDEKPAKVKILIDPNTQNIMNKIRSDTRLRKYGRITRQGDHYIYEDYVIGYDAFLRWLRSFGSSVKVLEPAFMAARMVQSARHMFKNNLTQEFTADYL